MALDEDHVAAVLFGRRAPEMVQADFVERAGGRGIGRARAYLARMAQARRAQQAAKDRFINANLRLVVATAQRFHRSGALPLADLIQEGNIGLMKAVDRFDHRRGYRFSTYATWWIRHYVTRAVADKGRLVRIPVHTLDAITRLARADAELGRATGATPDDSELAERAGLPEARVAALKQQQLLQRPLWLDRTYGEDQEQTLYDMLPTPAAGLPEESVDLSRFREHVMRLIRTLPSKQAAILRFRFGLDGEELTLREIGNKYDLSRERIRQLQEQALGNLRAALNAAKVGDNGKGAA
jgi:RNA polymerase primary sigma factor